MALDIMTKLLKTHGNIYKAMCYSCKKLEYKAKTQTLISLFSVVCVCVGGAAATLFLLRLHPQPHPHLFCSALSLCSLYKGCAFGLF